VNASAGKVGFVAFFLIWARVMRWEVPALHLAMVEWLERTHDPVRVLMVFRGAAKSTIYAIYKAWLLYRDPVLRNLIWSEDTKLAKKLTRDVMSILRRHPLCRGMLPQANPGTEEFWVAGAIDARNPSMAAYGVLSNATGSRADAIDFDDIEVPKNIGSAEAREKLRGRISEATHIMVPGGQKTYIGTPHTHDSLYDEQIEGGAAVLKIPLFEHHRRWEDEKTQTATRYRIDFEPGHDGLYVFAGIGKFARLLVEGRDYHLHGNEVLLAAAPRNVLDVYAGCAWPERFTRKDLERRRKDTRTLNAWDSQYQLESKPMHAVRLDPAKLIPFDVKPVIELANGGVRMMLGRTQIVSAAARWDCALGRLRGDTSAFGVVLSNQAGTLFWAVAKALTGDVWEQCRQIKQVVLELQLPRVVVETNGPGAFAPAVLKKVLHGTGCAVAEDFTTAKKNERILDAFEAPLSGGFLWAHVDVIDTVWDEMKDWKPTVKEQPDDHLDAGAGAIKDNPMRIGKVIGDKQTANAAVQGEWRPGSGSFDVTLELGE
jgi:hypothetical protein